jgi:transcriptional regulator with XRE-family HTH domain
MNSTKRISSKPKELSKSKSEKSFGFLLKERRQYHSWTLSDVSNLTGISNSALSKIENDLMSPTYQTIIKLCTGLDIEIGDLLAGPTPEQERPVITGRRSVSRQHQGQTFEDDNYSYNYLCGDVAHKRMIPMVVTVSANSFEQIGNMWSHVGEEFIYVLDGQIDLHTEFYEKLTLHPKDSVYIDSTMEHAFLAAGDQPATILILCSSATPNLAQTLRDILKTRLANTSSKMNRI